MGSLQIENIHISTVKELLKTIPKVQLSGTSIPSYHKDPKVQNLRLIQPEMVLITDLPRELMNDTELKSYWYLGQYGDIAKTTIIPGTGKMIVRYDTSFQAAITILALHLHRYRKGFPKASFCPIKYCPQMLMNKQCRESNCFNKHARQVEGHYFYLDNPKPISYHFELVCQILRKKKDKMREIFSRIKQNKKKATDYFPTIEETIDFYGIEDFLENYWSCQERIDQIDRKFAVNAGQDEYDLLFEDIQSFVSEGRASECQNLAIDCSVGSDNKAQLGNTTASRRLQKDSTKASSGLQPTTEDQDDNQFDFFEDNRNLEILNNLDPTAVEDDSDDILSDSEDGDAGLISSKDDGYFGSRLESETSMRLLGENGESFLCLSDLNYDFIKKYDAIKEDKIAKKLPKERSKEFYQYRQAPGEQTKSGNINEVQPTNLAAWSKQLLTNSNNKSVATPKKSSVSGTSYQEQTTSYTNTNNKSIITPMDQSEQTKTNYLNWNLQSDVGSFQASPKKPTASEDKHAKLETSENPQRSLLEQLQTTSNNMFGTQTSGFLSSELLVGQQGPVEVKEATIATRPVIGLNPPNILKEIVIAAVTKNHEASENTTLDTNGIDPSVEESSRSRIKTEALNSQSSSIDHVGLLEVIQKEEKLPVPKVAEKAKNKVQLVQVEGQSVFLSKKEKKKRKRGKRGQRTKAPRDQDKLSANSNSDSKASTLTDPQEVIDKAQNEKEKQNKKAELPKPEKIEPESTPGQPGKSESKGQRGKKLQLKIEKIESSKLMSQVSQSEPTASLAAQQIEQKKEFPQVAKTEMKNEGKNGTKISDPNQQNAQVVKGTKKAFQLKKESFSDDSESEDDQDMIGEDGNKIRIKKLDPGFEPEVLEHYSKLEIQDAVNLDIWQKAQYDKLDFNLPRQEKKKLRKKIKKKIRKEKDRRERQLDDCIYIDGLNIEDMKNVTRFQDDLTNFNALNCRFLKDQQGFEIDVNEEILQRFNTKSLPQDLIRQVLKHIPATKRQKVPNHSGGENEKFEPILETNEQIECTLDNLRGVFVDFNNQMRERQRTGSEHDKYAKELRSKAYDQAMQKILNRTELPDFFNEQLYQELDDLDEGIRQDQLRAKETDAQFKRSKSQGGARDDQSQFLFQPIGQEDEEYEDYEEGEEEEDDDDCNNGSQDWMDDTTLKRIYDCELQFEKYKNFRSLADSLYAISNDDGSAASPYSTIISMLNYLPKELGYPVTYEKNKEVTKFIIPVEDSQLMPNKEDYPF